jgi:hypothetical protein
MTRLIRLALGSLLRGIAQGGFQGGVQIAPHFGDALIAELAEEGRWLVVFKYSPALLILDENHPQRRVERGRKPMTRHFRGG